MCTFLSFPQQALAAGWSNDPAPYQVEKNRNAISGVVLDEFGDPVIGANIVIKGSQIGTTTNENGQFEVSGVTTGTLVISYIGYTTQEIKVKPGKALTINLVPDQQNLDEVVVTGYGTFKKSAYAGSAATVKASSVKDVPAISLNEMLQGAAPGVTMSSNSGIPGSATSLSIRGMGSFNASNSPLYVIDGVPVLSGNMSSLGTDSGLDALATLNPSDIESLTVIKDAAAASLYGSRAANGVIVITTKRGQVGKAKVNFKADWGFSDFAMPFRKTLSGDERRQALQEAFYNDYIKDYSEEEAKQYTEEDLDIYAPMPWCGYTDWTKELFKKGNHQNYEASISGGNDQAKYYASLGYMNQEGITANSGLERISGRVNVEFKASNKLTIGLNSLFSSVNQDTYGEGTSYTSPFYSSVSKLTPSDPVYNQDGSWNRDFIGNGDRNPILSQTYDSKHEYVTRHFNTLWAQYEFIKDLKFKTTLSYDYQVNKSKNWYDPRTSNGDDYNGLQEEYVYQRKKLVWANQLTYDLTWNDDHHADFLLGFETDDQSRDYVHAETQNFATSSKHELSNGAIKSEAGGSANGIRLVSYLGRVNYDYKNRYFAGASFRVDGSSRLHESQRWGSFWSASAAWRLIEENFMENTKEWLTDAKLRASYGVNGTLPSDYYGYYGLSSLTANYNGQPGIYPSQIENKDLKWEKNKNFNVGIDLGFWNRLNLTFEYYNRTTTDLLMDYPISMTTGFSSYLYNIGRVRNQGFEIDLRAQAIKMKDFSWTINFNLSHNANKVLELDGIQTEMMSGWFIHKVGLPYRTFYVYEFAGIDPEDGEPMFYTNDDTHEPTKELIDAYRIEYKHAEPALTGGLINTLNYKWFDLSFNFSYQFGGYGFDRWTQKTEHRGIDCDLSIPAYYQDRWKKPGDIATYEKMDAGADYALYDYYTNTRSIHSTDFIRLRNLTFGVTMPKKWTQKMNISRCRVFLSGNNLLTFAAYDYYDPESVNGGSSSWGTPPLKTMTFGIDLAF